MKESIPGTIAANIRDIYAKIRPLMKRSGTASAKRGEPTRPKAEMTNMIIVP